MVRSDAILKVDHCDEVDDEVSRAIDIHEIHTQCSVHCHHHQGSEALSIRRHCRHVECGLLEAHRWRKRESHDEEGVLAMLATCTLLRIGSTESLAILP